MNYVVLYDSPINNHPEKVLLTRSDYTVRVKRIVIPLVDSSSQMELRAIVLFN